MVEYVVLLGIISLVGLGTVAKLGSEVSTTINQTTTTLVETGVPTAGVPHTPDGGTPDGGTPDGGTPDGGTPDGGTPDGGTPDGGTPDGGSTGDGSTGDGGSGGGSSGGNTGGTGPGSTGYCPAGLTPGPSGQFIVNGLLVVDSSNDGVFAFGLRGGGLSETQRTIFTNIPREQEWYGDLVVFQGRYHHYRPTYIFPPNWNPDPGSC